MKHISTTNAPAALGPYSQAVDAGSTVYCSGQLGLDPATGALAEGVQAQTHQALKNLQAVLQEAGLTLDNVVKTTVFVQDLADFGGCFGLQLGAVGGPHVFPAQGTQAGVVQAGPQQDVDVLGVDDECAHEVFSVRIGWGAPVSAGVRGMG